MKEVFNKKIFKNLYLYAVCEETNGISLGVQLHADKEYYCLSIGLLLWKLDIEYYV